MLLVIPAPVVSKLHALVEPTSLLLDRVRASLVVLVTTVLDLQLELELPLKPLVLMGCTPPQDPLLFPIALLAQLVLIVLVERKLNAQQVHSPLVEPPHAVHALLVSTVPLVPAPPLLALMGTHPVAVHKLPPVVLFVLLVTTVSQGQRISAPLVPISPLLGRAHALLAMLGFTVYSVQAPRVLVLMATTPLLVPTLTHLVTSAPLEAHAKVV